MYTATDTCNGFGGVFKTLIVTKLHFISCLVTDTHTSLSYIMSSDSLIAETQVVQRKGFLPATSSSSHAEITPTPPLQESLPISTQQATVSTSTQTTDTAFALCVRCSNTQQTLIEVAGSIATLCHEQNEKSSMAEVDWLALAKVDGLELGKWRECLKTDLCSVSELCRRLKEKVRGLELECDTHKLMIGKLENEMEQLSTQMDTLQVCI